MNRLIASLLLVAAVAGCSSVSSQTTSNTRAAGGPKQIPVLHAETLVYECPKCGMDYDGPGQCSLDQSTLVKTAVAYACPSDGKPVEHSGKCPRCAAMAQVQKTTLADAGPAPAGGGQ